VCVWLFVDAAASFFYSFDGCLLMVSGSNSSIRNTVGKLMFQNIVFFLSFFYVQAIVAAFLSASVSVALPLLSQQHFSCSSVIIFVFFFEIWDKNFDEPSEGTKKCRINKSTNKVWKVFFFARVFCLNKISVFFFFFSKDLKRISICNFLFELVDVYIQIFRNRPKIEMERWSPEALKMNYPDQ